MKTTVKKIEINPNQRVIVVSDIHGHLDFLVQLLRKVDYSGDDVLVIVGDLVDKGPDSLRTLQYVMELNRKNQVYVTIGNVDLHRVQFLTDTDEEAESRFCKYTHLLQQWWGGGLLSDMFRELGIPLDKLTDETAGEYRALLREHFREEIDFMMSLPVVLEMGNYIFVHGGLPTDDLSAVVGQEAEGFLKNDCFLKQEHHFTKYMVVGHWPVCLYHDDGEVLAPIFDREKNIISIDGGCGVKRSGQLNALLIPGPGAAMDEISWTCYDEFPKVIAKERQTGALATIDIKYFASKVELLEERGDMSLFRQESTGKTFLAPAGHVWTDSEGGLHSDDYCDTRLEVEPGEELSVIWKTSTGCFAKKDGVLGWYRGAYEDVPELLELVSGRPAPEKMKARRQRELAVYDLLDRLGIEYQRIDHKETKTMALCAAVDEMLDAVICKNLFLRNQQKTKFYLLMMPGEKKFKTRELTKQINSARLSFAEAEYMEKFLHISPGSVSVLGLMNDTEHQVQLLIDRDILEGEKFGCHPCINTSSMRIGLRDLLEVFLPAIGHEPMFVELTGE
ncbi:MAG: metallophosphoesterase [Lachnospiraceae bacterium]|nr:metallophosphoesterase [Lachnospiraceae bacterium]